MGPITLKNLKLIDFRNVERLDVDLHERFNIVCGKNGMGKTNLLEAIYLLSVLRSFRTPARGEMVRHGAESARVRGLFSGVSAGLECEVTVSADERQVRVDDKAVTKVSDHFRLLPMVLFHPSNLALVQGGPVWRRRMLDRALFQAEPGYPALFGDYSRALANRNRLLRDGVTDSQAFAPYTEQCCRLACRIVRSRARFMEVLSAHFEESFDHIGKGLKAAVAYKPSLTGTAEEMMRALMGKLSYDVARRYTTAGPQVDDIEIEFQGRPARRFASQGQQRALVLALKIAKTRALFEVTEKTPLMLLDDMSSELDRDSNEKLFDFLLKTGGQVFITTTNLDHVLIQSDRLDLRIRDGQIPG